MLYNRRDMDSSHRQGAFKLAKVLSTTLQENLVWERFSML